MERKLDIYRKYKDELGVSLNKRERDKVLKHYDSTGVEVLMGRKMFNMRQVEAAVRIQSWWRRAKLQIWYNIVTRLRSQAALRIQRTFRQYLHLKVWPDMTKAMQHKAAITIQKYMRGLLTKNSLMHDI